MLMSSGKTKFSAFTYLNFDNRNPPSYFNDKIWVREVDFFYLGHFGALSPNSLGLFKPLLNKA